MMEPITQILMIILISGLIFLVITITIIIIFFSKLSNPIQKIINLMRLLTIHSAETILQADLNKKIIFVNPAFEKITGLKSQEIIGTKPQFDTYNISEKDVWKKLESGGVWTGKISIEKDKSDPIMLDAIFIPLKDYKGKNIGYLQIARDVTQELTFEKRLQQSQKLESIGTLAGGIAHDFNNILSGILGYSELILLKRYYDDKTDKYIKEIIKASERARDLVAQILTFSRQKNVELQPLLPKVVLKEALKLLRASIPASIAIQTKMNSDSYIMAEPTQIHQIAMNLFTNSVHAIGNNSGKITLEIEDFIVDEEFIKTHPHIKQGKHILLRISDNGCGIKQEILDNIFEPFFTTKTPDKGTGLGLSVVHGIVKKLNGIISIYSKVGEGTVFRIIIPSITSEVTKFSEDDFTLKKGTARIIIIDDEIAIVTTLKNIFTTLGYQITSFIDGQKALEELKTNSHNFDIVIMDYSMPYITGLDIAKELNDAGIKIPIILTSGYFAKDIEETAKKIGISKLLTKPVNIYKLSETIYNILKNKTK